MDIFHREAPKYTKLDMHLFPNIFNWTMSYRTDSDIYFPYVKVILAESKETILISNSSAIRRNKRGKVAWTVSHCDAHNKRDQFVVKLSKFIEIHVYGKCGNHTCRLANEDDGCFQQLEGAYKFYLAFENSLCHEYVTEKLFNALNRSIIPVVYGYGLYEKIAPIGSYINARSFHSVQDLGGYLNYLDKNPEEYDNYFEWKKYYQVKKDGDKDSWCDLCDKLLKSKVDSNRSYQWYSDLQLWFNSRTTDDKNRSFLQYFRSNSDKISDERMRKGKVEKTDQDEVCIPPFDGFT